MRLSDEPDVSLSPLKRALLALQDLRARLESAEGAKREPIAIIGIGCRFPGGVRNPETYWQLLSEGKDAVTEVPPERWDVDAFYDPDPRAPGKMSSRHGGFLDGIAGFDAHFFGISPREAVNMDPQQRLLLEVSWEALEHAGQAPQKLLGSRTGVFIGICTNDYLRYHLAGNDQVDAYTSTGSAHSVAAGRLSYALGLQGPAMAVDTACSSSLVTVHLACQSLRGGECDLALAGGVNLILSPDGTVALSQAQMLASDGRCKSFDAEADGYARSEGCGMVLLKRLSDALRDGDQILALVRGSAVNQDGRSNGLTAPNGLAQQSVISAALANGGVTPAQVSYIEAHGTGTALGDPMEVQALDAVLSAGRSKSLPLMLGSVKTNLGHSEAAAGIAGLIKVVLALQHREIPPHIHLRRPTPHISWDELPIVIPTEPTAWRAIEGKRIAGVSSFGYAGTNAHVVLEEAPARETAPAGGERPRHILTLSAKHPDALADLTRQIADTLAAHALADVCYSANSGRSHFVHRLAVVGTTEAEVREKLLSGAGLLQGERQSTAAPEVTFLFAGQGDTHAGLGRQLYETQPTFRASFDQCGELLGVASLLDQSPGDQRALFAFEYALAELWRSWGVTPTSVLGWGVGEHVAACIAGSVGLEDGLKLAAGLGRDDFAAIAAEVHYAEPRLPLITNRMGRRIEDFDDGIRGLPAEGSQLLVQVCPRPDGNDWDYLLGSLARLYTQGVDIDWSGFDRDYPRRRVPLPTYPFQRQRYWPLSSPRAGVSSGPRLHPLLERRVSLPLRDVVFETRLRSDAPAFLADHVIQGVVVVPAAVYLEMALAAATESWGSGAHTLLEISFQEALVLRSGDEEQNVDLVLTPIEVDTASFQIFRRAAGGWSLHASGKIRKGLPASAPQTQALAELRERCPKELNVDAYYQTLRSRGLEYGPAFQGVTWIACGAGEALGEVRLPEALKLDAGAYHFHPALLDACLQALGAALPETESPGDTYVLSGMESFCFYGGKSEQRLWSHAQLRTDKGGVEGDVTLLDGDGRVVAEVLGLRAQPVRGSLRRAATDPADWIYTIQWKPVPLPSTDREGAGLDVLLDRVRAQYDLDSYESLLPEFDALCREWVMKALSSLGWHPKADPGSLGVLEQHRRLLRRMLEMIEEDGGWEACSQFEFNPKARGTALAARFPACAAEIAMLKRCGENLASVLRGECDPLQLLFPEGSLALLERAYVEEPFARAGNALIQQAVADMLAQLPAERPVRMLEIGAGTGGTTAALLPQLPADRVQYAFTDVSQLFLRKARQKFREYSFVTYRVLDIERDPEAQGLGANQFDIVVAANVLHATSDLRRTLEHIHKLLSRDGRLVVLEGTAPQRKTDLVFGLAAGWWRFKDTEIRPSHPLLPARAWLRLLNESGFGGASVIPRVASPWAVIVADARRSKEQRCWLILPDAGGVGEQLATLLEARGDRCVLADPSRLDYIPACDGVIHLPALDADAERLNDCERRICGSALDLIQGLARHHRARMPTIWLVTRGAQPIGPDVTASGVVQAPLWGLGRVLANEHPELFGGLIDLDPTASLRAQAAALFDAIHRPDAEEQVAFRRQQRYVPRLVRAQKPSGAAAPLLLREDGVYLITGGLGGLGLALARWLVARGARHLVLSGRRDPSAPAAEAVRDIEQAGATVVIARMDVSRAEDVTAVLSHIEPRLRGVIHAAGVLDDGTLLQQDWTRFAAVFASKVEGAWNLHTLTQHLDLDFFVLFSSASSLLGAPGQANYAAANAFLDALVHHRRARGATALSVDWGPWAEVGLAAAMGLAGERRYAAQGIELIPPAAGFRLLESALHGPDAQVAVLPIQWPTYLRQFAADRVPPLFSEVVDQPLQRTQRAPQQSGAWTARLAAVAPAKREELLTALVQEQAARVLRLDHARAVSPRQPLQELGLDSLMAVELRNALGEALGRTLPSILIFDYPTIEALSGYLAREMALATPAAETPAQPVDVERPQEPSMPEPIAIIGAGCRIPGGGDDPESFWKLLRDGVDAIGEVPPDRWDIDAYYDPNPDAPGKMYTRWGGFLSSVDQFDAQFFGITPREAVSMDPQQRLLLEVTWEALERAGQSADRLQGSQTGVFVGISCYDYYHLARRGGEASMDAYSSTGVAFSVAPGRLAYVLGLQGPTMAIDTACSSSLVTIHLACQSLRNGECGLALAGGVNLILSPENTIASSRLRSMAADGRCKTFDARADGYVRGEGCGMVVLKRLSDAVRDRDNIMAVIRGSAVNQDGRSNGLTAPNGPAQEALIRRALATAGVRGEDVGYVEAHGTGTSLGDPIEVHALGAVLGPGRAADQPLMLGSVKTNIGHLESSAGVVGLIKAALVVQLGEIPPHLHLQQRNPYIDWEHLPVTVPAMLTKWPENGRRIAGVSAFGYSGTNAHVILEQPPEPSPAAPNDNGRSHLLPLSARSADALEDLARGYREWLVEAPSLHDLCYTASVRRSHHEHRLALAGRSSEELREHLNAWLDRRPDAGTWQGVHHPGQRRRVVFVFPGQGSQWTGMGRELLAGEPVFRAAMSQCDAAVRKETGWSVLSELAAGEEESRLGQINGQINVIQPVLFSMQVALGALWRSWGVEPDAVIGHSMGEVAAAHVAGALSLEDAARIICRRSQLLTRVAGRGAMAVAELPVEEAHAALNGYTGRLTIAVNNSPRSTVFAGDPAALQEVLETLEQRGVFCRWVKVDVASHSPYMDELREDLMLALNGVASRPADVPMYSTVSSDGGPLDAGYWVRNLREPVRFADAIGRAVADGFDLFLEISPHPVLLPAIEDNLRHLQSEGSALTSLRREEPERATMLGALGALYTQGFAIDWRLLYPNGGECVRLPAYPWQRQRFWITDGQVTQQSHPEAIPASLLGAHVESSLQPGTHLWERELSLEAFPYLRDHTVQGLAVLPAAAYLELALSASAELFATTTTAVLEEVEFEQMLALPEGETKTVQLAVTGSTFQILSRQSGSWMVHARGSIRSAPQEAPPAVDSLALIQARCSEVHSGAELYRKLEQRGLEYGPSFQGVEQIWRGDGEALGLVHLPITQAGGYRIHPALLDACFQVMGMAAPTDGEIYLPVALHQLRVLGEPGRVRWSYARLVQSAAQEDTLAADLLLLNEQGQIVIEARGLEVKRLEQGVGRVGPTAMDDWLYELQWQLQVLPISEPSHSGRWLILADRGGVGASLGSLLNSEIVYPSFERSEDFGRLLESLHREGPLRGIVHLWSLDVAADEIESIQELCLSTVRLVQALAEAGWRDAPRLYLVTRGAHMVNAGDSPASVAQAPLWGLGRTISYEYPEFLCTKIDLDGRAPDAQALFRELAAADREDQVALRGERRYVARLVKRPFEPVVQYVVQHEVPAGDRPFRLELLTPGVLDGLTLVAAERPKPGPGEVEIEIHASGLNFLDVLTAVGAIPSNPPTLGSECAGRISDLGEGVTDVSVGQEVIAIAPRSFGCFAIASRALIAPKPAHLSFDEAATIPVAFLTAWYSLHHIARLMPGERVLIHAASGGVGLAAVQIARRTGAEIYATAGSQEKRDWLKTLGVHHVLDSRSLAFAGAVRELTGGEGVDVVLNSLAGEFIDVSLELLRDYGRFIEIGKRDYLANRALGSRPFLRNLSFSLVDLRGMILNRPDLVRTLLAEILPLFETRELQAIPQRVFPIGDAREAFLLMAQAKHIGKIVLSLEGREVTPIVPSEAPPLFPPDRTYLITGGLGGLGLITARWMIQQGARHLLLVGRNAPSPAVEGTLAELRGAGAEVVAARADVAQHEQIAAVLSEARCTMPPLAGVFHAAGVLEDGLLAQLDGARFQRVADPKIAGAWNLHLLTRELPLDFFVLYSSGSSMLGSPGQGNYAAANAFLDALAHSRRAQGLPALSINWGPWAEVGLAAVQADRGGRLAQRGFESIAPDQGMEMLGRLLRQGQALTQIGVLPINLRQWRQSYPQLARMPLLAQLVEREQSPQPSNQMRAALLAAGPSERTALLETHLQEQIARVVRLPAAQIEPRTSFKSFGLDSLMALELRNCLEASLGLTLPVTMIFGYPNVTALAAHLMTRLEITAGTVTLPEASHHINEPAINEQPKANGQPKTNAQPKGADRIGQLSDDEVDRLLAARMSRKEN